MAQYGAVLYRNFRVYQVYGANTNVGKTIFSTLLSRAATRDGKQNVWYLKPVSTGPQHEEDVGHLQRFAPGVRAQNFFQFKDPVSPHLAATGAAQVSDHALVEKTSLQIRTNAEAGSGLMLVETAGGPHSPGPSGTSQADLYRPLRLPLLLVADARLGGISTSISAFESLRLRGYDVDGVTIFDDKVYQNADYLGQYFQDKKVPFLSVVEPPSLAPTAEQDHASLQQYYSSLDGSSSVSSFLSSLSAAHEERLERVENLADRAFSRVWWPFAQHSELAPEKLNTIDSAYGDYFQTYKRPKPGRHEEGNDANVLQPTVDGSASWWTQGLGHANSRLTLSAAYAAGRYGHVMFANSVNEPAIELADRLLTTVTNPRISRVFYSDNGSSAMEIGVKMALKAACDRYGFVPSKDQVDIIGFKNSYHGDTIGSMDMSEPSTYNEKVPWYRGKGFWFDSPSVMMKEGQWIIEKPAGLARELGDTSRFASLQDVYSADRDNSSDAQLYRSYIRTTLERLTQEEKRKFGALVFEPIILGAGGMVLADPLFQRVLVQEVRASSDLFGASDSVNSGQTTEQHSSSANALAWTGLPVVADEIFTGLYRLGHPYACELLHFDPDISSHAKLLTGGLLPLAITAASESIFDAFVSEDKADALLHGHSYTAHAIGCAVANSSLQQMAELAASAEWDAFKSDWSGSASILGQLKSTFTDLAKTKPVLLNASGAPREEPQIWSKWSQAFVTDLSNHTQRVESVWAHGSVIAITITDGTGKGGYTSTAAIELRDKLYEGADGWNIHSRVLGNVLYLIASQVVPVADVRKWETRIRQALGM